MAKYICPECNLEIDWFDKDYKEKGEPVCPDCDVDMEMSDVDKENEDRGWKFVGTFGVDSGQVLITDPCYVSDWKGTEFNEDEVDRMKKDGVFDYSYSGACARTLKDNVGTVGIGCDGVVSSTGYGDGEYGVYALFEDKRVKELRIKFF
jgi:hypothetical protein